MAMNSAGIVNKGIIGKGAFGVVYLVQNAEGEQFAVKVMEWARAGHKDRGVVQNELRVLKELTHEHVLCYTDHFMDKGLVYIITEFCGGGDVSGFLDHVGCPLPEDLLCLWLWQMACGLEYMHTHESGPILHRDLKPTNVFLTETATVRLGDVGIARVLESPDAMAETFCGTPPYMSPEALREKPYNSKTDIWSLGCCVVEMATMERAYEGSNLFILRNAVLKMRQPLPLKYSRELDQLVSKMLCSDHTDRFSATQVLDDPMLQHCEHRAPMDLIVNHNLQDALAMHRRRPSPTSTSTTTASLSTAFKVKADETVLTLTDSMANIAAILDEGEPITTYRVKVHRRMRGRRHDDDTITNSDSLKTVLYKPQSTEKPKTAKKILKVPSTTTKVKSPTVDSLERDDTLSRTVLSLLTSSVKTFTVKNEPDAEEAAQDNLDQTCDSSTSRSTLMESLRSTLDETLGSSTMDRASTLVTSATSRQELTDGLAPLVGEYQFFLSNVVIYLLLMESTSRTT